MTIPAKSTRYKGYHFRSRLEARWAVYFDRLNIRWEYEPDYLDGGYLPDFWLPDVEGYYRTSHPQEVHTGEYLGVYVEVKGTVDKATKFRLNELVDAGGPKEIRHHGLPLLTGIPFLTVPHYGDPKITIAGFRYLTWYKGANADYVQFSFLNAEPRRIWLTPVFENPNTIGPCILSELDSDWSDPPYWDTEFDDDFVRWRLLDHVLMKQGFDAARSARFEHGANGAT